MIAWGLLIPLLIFFLGPQFHTYLPPGRTPRRLARSGECRLALHRASDRGRRHDGRHVLHVVPHAQEPDGRLGQGVLRTAWRTVAQESVGRTERYMSSKTVFALIGCTFLVMCVLYVYLSGLISGGIAAALVMLIVGFFFATVSGYLVGVIGSSNNPISGLTLSTLVIAALLMVSLGVSGMSGVVAVLGVAAVVCVSSAVAGELLQDFKVGYILGGTPRTIQITELIAVVVASLVMYFPLMWLHQGNINRAASASAIKLSPRRRPD